ncbi:RNA polymerase sigma factor [Longispora albida]|uniref:RNA polymerase sigma factor n=1 Tax=Longispora albida TaxID=203523 RepID=UPI00035FDEE7|nr:sigma-70 family RNA polymerase sigma factor [Longispora albida]
MVAELAMPGAGDPEDVHDVGTLYAKHGRGMVKFAYHHVGDAAEDAVHEAFVIAMKKRGSYDPARAQVRSWLMGILVKVLLKKRSEAKRYLLLLEAQERELHVQAPVPDEADRHATRLTMIAAMRLLSPDDRVALFLIDWDGMTYEEAAETLRVPAGTIKSRVNRARKKASGSLHDQEEA